MDFSLSGRLIVALALAAALSYATTPIAILAARRFAFYDVPLGYKGHTNPTPYLGGAAVISAFVIALVIAAGHPGRTLPLLAGVMVMFILGTIDDRRPVSPQLRVAVEFALGAWLSLIGLGWHFQAGAEVNVVINGAWIVGVVNAFNLFDNMDGAASTIAIVAAAGACTLAWITGNGWAAVGAAALGGACLGFLPHNLASPARIFLGDGGSMPVGFTVAVLTASAARAAEPSVLALMTGLLLVGIPALDTTLVIVSRRRRGVSILSGGRDHLTHRTRRRMRTARRVALVLGSAQALVSGLVVIATRAGTTTVVYVALAFVVCAVAVIIGLEFSETPIGGAEPSTGAVAGGLGLAAAVAPLPSAGLSGAAMRDAAMPGPGPRQTTAAGPVRAWSSTLATQARAVAGVSGAVASPRDAGVSASRRGSGESSAAPAPDSLWPARSTALGLAVLGLGAGLSPLFSAYYDAGVWVPIGLGLVVAAAAAAVARPHGITRPAIAALSGLGGLGLWSLLSTGWAQSVESATVDANRWLSYAALLLLLVVLARGRRHATVMLVAVGVGITVVAVSLLVRMLGADPAQLFLGGRLNSPLGYINGEGCVFAMGCWIGLALAERREPVLAGLGTALAVAMACLTLLSQSRGAAIASLVALLVALVAVPGVRRRLLALAGVAGGIAIAASSVLKVYSSGQNVVAASVAHHAAVAILAGAALAGVLWGVLVALGAGLERRGPGTAGALQRCATVLAVLVVAVPVLAAVVRSSSIERTVRTQWHAFVHLSDPSDSSSAAQSRLLSGAGNRYDYWRVAWHVFLAHPIAGVGAGNYSASYYRERRTEESIDNPHSVELQTASELGIVGLALLALMLAGVAVGARRLRRAARRAGESRTLMVAATGMFVVWLVDTSGDWMHLLPGVSAIALLAAAILVQTPAVDVPVGTPAVPVVPVGAPAPAGAPRRRAFTVLAGTAAVAFLLAVAGASLLRSGLVSHYLDDAQAELRDHPGAAIRDAGRALRLDSANLDAYYVQAAGQARFDEAGPARATLLDAANEDPQNFVTWALLGDLEVRLRDFRAARSFYGRAHALDPNDPSLSELAAHPRSALAQTQ